MTRYYSEYATPQGVAYLFCRNQSSLLAFTLPPKWRSGSGLSIVATHVDSPNLRIRPTSNKSSLGYCQVAVETSVLLSNIGDHFLTSCRYGGGIWHSWLDRDLSVAGRIVVTDNSGTNFTSKLVKVNKPVLRIPSLAIHCMFPSPPYSLRGLKYYPHKWTGMSMRP